MTVTYTGFGAVLGAFLGAAVASPVVGNGIVFAAFVLAGGIVGAFAWAYSPLPDSNGGMAGSRFRGKYWGWSPPSEMTTEAFVCGDCGHGPMAFDTRADDLHLRFEANEKDLFGRRIRYVGRCDECGAKIGWRDKESNPPPEPPEGYELAGRVE